MIFDWKGQCAPGRVLDLVSEEPVILPAGQLWVVVVSSGGCTLPSGVLAQAGTILLFSGGLTLSPLQPCHLAGVELTGALAAQAAQSLDGPLAAQGSSCPGAAELVALLGAEKNPLQASVLGYSLLCELSQADAARPALPPLAAAAVAAIRQNYAGLYGVEELSSQLGVSKEHLVRVFRKAMGVTPGQYLTQVRLETAKLLLLHREYTLEVVASLCGFSGANYFCRVFKKETGLTPLEWRRLNRSAAQDVPPPLPQELELYV